MAEIQTKSCLSNTFWVLIVLVTLSTADGKNNAAESKDNNQTEKQLGCEKVYLNNTVISLDMSELNSNCLRIMAPPGMGIRMDFPNVNSSWSIYDFFYIQLDQNCDDDGIIVLIGKPNPCSTSFNTSTLEIHLHASLIVDFSSFSTIDRGFLQPVCNVPATVGQSHDSKPCTYLEMFNRVHNFTNDIISYSKMIGQHPSLDFNTFPDVQFQQSELPLLNLATTGKFVGYKLEYHIITN